MTAVWEHPFFEGVKPTSARSPAPTSSPEPSPDSCKASSRTMIYGGQRVSSPPFGRHENLLGSRKHSANVNKALKPDLGLQLPSWWLQCLGRCLRGEAVSLTLDSEIQIYGYRLSKEPEIFLRTVPLLYPSLGPLVSRVLIPWSR